MPIPKPEPQEEMQDYLDRCMADDVMTSEYPNRMQRLAICAKEWTKK